MVILIKTRVEPQYFKWCIDQGKGETLYQDLCHAPVELWTKYLNPTNKQALVTI